MIKFSIITVTYNVEEDFLLTAESMMIQEYPNVEHLIIDGASQDGTVSVAEDYKRRSKEEGNEHEITIISEPDKGIYDAMNKGLQLVTGDYVLFLNAGDLLPYKDTLSQIAQMAEMSGDGNTPAVFYGDTYVVDEDGRMMYRRRLSPPERLTWKSFRHGMLVCHQAFYARADIAKKLPYNLKYRYSSDVDWCIRVMKEAQRQHLALKNLNRVAVHYMYKGMTTKHHKESLMERFRIMCHHYGYVSTVVMHVWFAIRSLIRH